jgi:predicted nucleic acid-binding protein
MAYLLDTSILGRLANSSDANHSIALQAVTKLHDNGELLYICPQNLIEFRNVATRPIANNGLGLDCAVAETIAAQFESLFPLLPESADIFPAWKMLVTDQAVQGKQVHDARLVATCHVYGISHLLTFNVSHFARFEATKPGLVVESPTTT